MAAGEERQFADDLSDSGAARESDQSFAGQSTDQVRVCDGRLHRQQRQKHLRETDMGVWGLSFSHQVYTVAQKAHVADEADVFKSAFLSASCTFSREILQKPTTALQ